MARRLGKAFRGTGPHFGVEAIRIVFLGDLEGGVPLLGEEKRERERGENELPLSARSMDSYSIITDIVIRAPHATQQTAPNYFLYCTLVRNTQLIPSPSLPYPTYPLPSPFKSSTHPSIQACAQKFIAGLQEQRTQPPDL